MSFITRPDMQTIAVQCARASELVQETYQIIDGSFHQGCLIAMMGTIQAKVDQIVAMSSRNAWAIPPEQADLVVSLFQHELGESLTELVSLYTHAQYMDNGLVSQRMLGHLVRIQGIMQAIPAIMCNVPLNLTPLDLTTLVSNLAADLSYREGRSITERSG